MPVSQALAILVLSILVVGGVSLSIIIMGWKTWWGIAWRFLALFGGMLTITGVVLVALGLGR